MKKSKWPTTEYGFQGEGISLFKKLGKKVEFILKAELVYLTRSGLLLRIPSGLRTDLASIPRFLRSVIPKVGKYDAGSVLHDWLYQVGILSRKESDKLFLESMKSLGVRWTQRHAIYRGVRLGGWVAWRKYRKAEKK